MNIEALLKVSYGMYVVSSFKGEKFNGQIANTVFQVAAKPPMIAVSINRENLTHELIGETKILSVSILSEDTPLEFIGLFGFNSGKDINKFENIAYKVGKTGVPIVLGHTLGYLECEVVERVEVYTHTIFTAKIVEAEIVNDGKSMTYSYYHEVKRGKSPKTAPTYVEPEKPKKKEKKQSRKYECTVCGYIYDPEIGDPDRGTAKGTPFEDLPDDWVCPVCGMSKDMFEVAAD